MNSPYGTRTPIDVLVIPPHGLMELFQSDKPIAHQALVRWADYQGDYAEVEVVRDGQEFKIGMLINNPNEQVNTRAREACAEFFGWHMVFVGPMFIAGLSDEQAREILEVVS